MTTVGETCRRDMVIATRDTTVAAAARLMRRNLAGTVVVCNQLNGTRCVPLGIVTERDIVMRVVALGLRPEAITVGEIMGSKLATARETDDVLLALQIMRAVKVQYLPILRDDGCLVGVVSIEDLLSVLADGLTSIAKPAAPGPPGEATMHRPQSPDHG
ncbi:MAG TPA: CBS domain-containing protein [Burkholderiales bacterium]|nr:CBS domain-containing protein [Burkholderiales bacterium]